MLRSRDVLEWDVVNWSVALRIWESYLPAAPCRCLEIGSCSGKLSLWLASKGHHVVCSDRTEPDQSVQAMHESHGVAAKIEYRAVDATDIPCTDRFDVIVFKSVLGRIWALRGTEGLRRAAGEMHKALKPNGLLLFAENLRATKLHMFCRTRLAGFNESVWKYPTLQEMLALLADFANVDYRLAGVLGAFGRSETQRTVLGLFDKAIAPLTPKSWRYVMAGVAVKRAQDQELPAAWPRAA
jgi:SAM-dependent methyltransferase